MADLDSGIDLWRTIAEDLNEIIARDGEIRINNKHIWDDILHKLSNEQWRDILAAYALALDEQPELVQGYRKTNLETARAILLKAKIGERPLDRKSTGGKRAAWAMINTLRETWNEINPTVPTTAVKETRPARPKTVVETTDEYTRVTVFHNIFDINE